MVRQTPSLFRVRNIFNEEFKHTNPAKINVKELRKRIYICKIFHHYFFIFFFSGNTVKTAAKRNLNISTEELRIVSYMKKGL